MKFIFDVKSQIEVIFKNMKFIINVKSPSKHEIHPNDLNFKAYVCHVQTKVYIHILNTMSPQKYMHEGTWLKDVYV